MITFLLGDATQPVGDGPQVIVHVCNDIGRWGRGFVLALSRRWKAPEASYRAWCQEQPLVLGEVRFVTVEPTLWVANLIGQQGIAGLPGAGSPPVRYDAIRVGLERVAVFALEHQAAVHMPRIGTGLGGGQWEEIEGIIKDTLVDVGVQVFVYDLTPSRSVAL